MPALLFKAELGETSSWRILREEVDVVWFKGGRVGFGERRRRAVGGGDLMGGLTGGDFMGETVEEEGIVERGGR